MTGDERMVIFASSLGTVFEWYDFYLYGWTAAQIGAAFYSAFDANTQFIFALLTFFGRLPGASARCAGVWPRRRPRRSQVHLPRDHHDHGFVDLPRRIDAGLRGDRLACTGDPDRASPAAGSGAGR